MQITSWVKWPVVELTECLLAIQSETQAIHLSVRAAVASSLDPKAISQKIQALKHERCYKYLFHFQNWTSIWAAGRRAANITFLTL